MAMLLQPQQLQPQPQQTKTLIMAPAFTGAILNNYKIFRTEIFYER